MQKSYKVQQVLLETGVYRIHAKIFAGTEPHEVVEMLRRPQTGDGRCEQYLTRRRYEPGFEE